MSYVGNKLIFSPKYGKVRLRKRGKFDIPEYKKGKKNFKFETKSTGKSGFK